jgi:Tfp pilus assembly protein PilO
MIVLAVLLLLGSGGWAAAVVISNLNAHNQAIQVAGSNIFHWQISGIFIAGMVTAAVFGLGLYFLFAGGVHRIRVASRDLSQRREVRNLRSERQSTAEDVEADRAQMHAELEAERADHLNDLRRAASGTKRRAPKAPAAVNEGS